MKYTVYTFKDGKTLRISKHEAKSYKDAARQRIEKNWFPFDHITVVGKSIRRYTPKLKPINIEARAFKAYSGSKPSVLLLLGNIPELIRFAYVDNRDKAYEELCSQTSAKTASPDPQSTNITASSEETSASKDGLTSPKILSGFAVSVTSQVKLILSSIDKPSGRSRSKGSASPIWQIGSTPSHSKPTLIFATVKNLNRFDEHQYPGITYDMKRMVGKTIKVKNGDNSYYGGYYGEGYYWNKDWLDFEHVVVTVKNDISPTSSDEGIVWVRKLEQYKGKTLDMIKCGSYNHYKYQGWCFAPEWLEAGKVHRTQCKKFAKFLGNVAHGSVTYLPAMDKDIGMVGEVKEATHGNYKMLFGGKWYVAKEWLEFVEPLTEAQKKYASLPFGGAAITGT